MCIRCEQLQIDGSRKGQGVIGHDESYTHIYASTQPTTHKDVEGHDRCGLRAGLKGLRLLVGRVEAHAVQDDGDVDARLEGEIERTMVLSMYT